MSVTNWTPGPWEYGVNSQGYFSNEVVIRPKGQFPHGLWIADCGSRADKERNANACLIAAAPDCAHDRIPYWKADCPECARKALRMAIALKTRYEPVRQIDPHEDPIVGFRRREAEAQDRLKAAEKLALPAGEEL
jgi:hypothetical protein